MYVSLVVDVVTVESACAGTTDDVGTMEEDKFSSNFHSSASSSPGCGRTLE